MIDGAQWVGPVPVPLTFGQRARLLAQCWPLVAFALMVAGYLVVVSRGMIPAPPPLFQTTSNPR